MSSGVFDMRKLLLFLLFLGMFSFAVDISNCQALTAATFYRVTADISTPLLVCFNATGNNVTLNLDGHVITGRNNNSFWNDTSTETNITIMNGTVANFSNAFRDVGASTLWRIENITFANISNTSGGAIFSALSTSNFTNLTIRNSTTWTFQSTSSSVNFTNSNFFACNDTCLNVISGSDAFFANSITIVNASNFGFDFSDTATDGVRVQNSNITNASFAIRFNNLGSDGGTIDNVLIRNSTSGFRNDFTSQMNVSNSTVYNTTSYVNNGEMNMTNVTFGRNSSVNINWNGTFVKTDTQGITEGTGIIASEGIMFVSVNASRFPYLNTSANISLQTDVNCINSSVYVAQGFPATAAAIIAADTRHKIGNPCTVGLMSFNASSFSGFAAGPPLMPQGFLVSPLNSNLTGAIDTFSWTCNHSDQASLTGTLFINNSQVVQVTCSNNSLCSYPYANVNACTNITWLVNCANADFPTGNNSTASSFNQVPDPVINSPANNSSFYNIQALPILGNATCVANQSVFTIGNTNYTASCSAQSCNVTNMTRDSGAYNITIWYQSYLGIWFNSSYITIFSNSSIPGVSNVTFNTTFTYDEFIAHTNGFYVDYGPHIFAILSYAFAFLLTRRYPATLIAGGIGFVTVFFLFGAANFAFLAAGILSIVLGYGYKQVVG